jgi:2-phosphosulfolactate phosphatase
VASAASHGDLLVIIDILSFSSAVATAVQFGGFIIPCRDQAEAHSTVIHQPDVIEAVRRGGKGSTEGSTVYSLSPPSYIGFRGGATVALPSPNGAACCRQAGDDTIVYTGCFLNCAAVASRISELLHSSSANVTVVASGERWGNQHEDGHLRFAVEDYLGAGAILNSLPFSKSPEAEVCANAFGYSQRSLSEMLHNCGSGIELRKKGYAQDVEHCSMLNVYDSVPVLRRGRFEPDA